MESIRKLYFGRYSLPFTFWVFRIIVIIISIPVFEFCFEKTNYGGYVALKTFESLFTYYFFYFSSIFIICLSFYSDIATWNCATNYKNSDLWKYSTKFIIGLSLLIGFIGVIYLFKWGSLLPFICLSFMHIIMKNEGGEIVEGISNYHVENKTPTYYRHLNELEEKRRKNELHSSEIAMKEDELYLQIDNEFKNNTIDRALWLKIFSENDGNENLTKAKYIKERLQKLKAI